MQGRVGNEGSKEHEVVEDDLNNPELQEILKSAKAVEELVALAKEEGVELTDDNLRTAARKDLTLRTCFCCDVPVESPVRTCRNKAGWGYVRRVVSQSQLVTQVLHPFEPILRFLCLKGKLR